METTSSAGAGVIQLVLLVAFLIPAIFFLLTQYNTLRVIRPENRVMRPGLVWLQLIPLVGLIWQFIVVARIASSIRNQWQVADEDSILGIDAQTADSHGTKPTLKIGMAYCNLTTGAIVCNYLFKASEDRRLSALLGLVLIVGMVCCIIYWVQLAGWKRRLKQRGRLAVG